jgi:predicted ATPase
MLTNLSLQNIKSFNREATLKIAPITLIYGANSSGKSTLWKFLTILKNSLGGYHGKNFINLSRSYGFANNKTLSFDPNLDSNFGFKFSSIYESDVSYGPSFFEDDGTTLEVHKDNKGNTFSKTTINNLEDKGVKFVFSFENENKTTNSEEKKDDIDQLDEIIKKMHSKAKDKISSDEQELLKSLKDLHDKQKKIADKIKKVENVLDSNKEKNINLKELKVFKDNKLFATYKIYQLNSESVSRRLSQRITREAKIKNKRKIELEIKKILQENFNKKFKFETKIKTRSREWDDEVGSKLKDRTFVFDFIGPDGPHDIKIDDDLGYLFIPTWVSDDKFFWKEHYDILQTMKKLMKDNSSNKDLEEKYKYKRYFEEDYNQTVHYYDAVYGIPADDLRKDVPEIANTYNKTLDAMTASFEDFAKIMSEDLKTLIFKGDSFLPKNNFYGGTIYQNIFDSLASKWVDTFVETEQDNLSQEGIEFLDKYSTFVKFSYDDQFKNLSKFSRELRNFKHNNSENYRPGMGYGMRMHPSYVSEILHEDPKHKDKIIKLLEKINLPFKIDTQTDEDGDIKASFSNKKITKSQEGIPLEQSGNGLKSVLTLLSELIKSENSTMIIEEPENKIHPQIQGNLIELITEIIKNNSSNAIIETHSEHFILRIQKLIREKKISPKLIAINYVYLDENGEGSKIDHMQINDNGKFTNKWRHGFFNERLKEI